MAADQVLTKNFEAAIENVLGSELERIQDDIIARAAAEFERKAREAVGHVVINLAEYYSVQRLGSDLIIHVKIGESK